MAGRFRSVLEKIQNDKRKLHRIDLYIGIGRNIHVDCRGRLGQQTKISDGVTDNFEQLPLFNLFACPALGVPANSFDNGARALCLSDDLICGNADQLHRIGLLSGLSYRARFAVFGLALGDRPNSVCEISDRSKRLFEFMRHHVGKHADQTGLFKSLKSGLSLQHFVLRGFPLLHSRSQTCCLSPHFQSHKNRMPYA